MALNVLKRDIADGGDPADFGASLERYSLTDRAPVECANQTEANQIAAELENAGMIQAFPLFVYVEDSMRHLCKPAPDEGWIILGGRLHGAHVKVDRSANSGELTELHVVEFLKQSVGFTRHAGTGGIQIPETGLYRVRLGGRIKDFHSSTAGRRFFSLKLNGENLGGNVEFEGDTSAKVFDEWPFEKGDVLMAEAYHATGARRVFEATLGVYQSLDPSW